MQDELEFFQSWWKILKKYWNPPARHDRGRESTEFWAGIVNECLELPKKYKHNELFYPFACKMSLALIYEVSRRADELHEDENRKKK